MKKLGIRQTARCGHRMMHHAGRMGIGWGLDILCDRMVIIPLLKKKVFEGSCWLSSKCGPVGLRPRNSWPVFHRICSCYRGRHYPCQLLHHVPEIWAACFQHGGGNAFWSALSFVLFGSWAMKSSSAPSGGRWAVGCALHIHHSSFLLKILKKVDVDIDDAIEYKPLCYMCRWQGESIWFNASSSRKDLLIWLFRSSARKIAPRSSVRRMNQPDWRWRMMDRLQFTTGAKLVMQFCALSLSLSTDNQLTPCHKTSN